ncbi:MAG TPA: hypothetical protein DDZ84_10840 [Firmicutes bacterium]|nr:hypothetical protein [Bacillota bacterium]
MRPRSKRHRSSGCLRLDQGDAERADRRAYGYEQNIHSLRPGAFRLSTRIQRAVLQSAALLSDLAIARGDGSCTRLLNKLSRVRLLVLDDWGTVPLGPSESRDILGIVDDRTQLTSTSIASQLPVDDWHASILDPSVADAVRDRLVHNSCRIRLKGKSMRRVEQRSQRTTNQGA